MTAPQRRVLVLMATHNGARWIDEQLDSIQAQVGVSVSIRACDDGSVDDTVTRIERSCERGVDVVLHRSAAPARGAGRNFLRLIRETDVGQHDYVALSDQDDLWYADKLLRAVSSLESQRAHGYSAAVRAVWPDGRARVLGQSLRRTKCDYLFEGAGQGCTFVVAAPAFTQLRNDLVCVGVSALELHYHDWLLYALTRTRGLTWIFDPIPSMDYRQHAENDTGARNSLPAATKRISLIRSGWYALQIRKVATICHEINPAAAAPAWLIRLVDSNDLLDRMSLMVLVWTCGRRRRLDNVVLVFAALFGWLHYREPRRPPNELDERSDQ